MAIPSSAQLSAATVTGSSPTASPKRPSTRRQRRFEHASLMFSHKLWHRPRRVYSTMSSTFRCPDSTMHWSCLVLARPRRLVARTHLAGGRVIWRRTCRRDRSSGSKSRRQVAGLERWRRRRRRRQAQCRTGRPARGAATDEVLGRCTWNVESWGAYRRWLPDSSSDPWVSWSKRPQAYRRRQRCSRPCEHSWRSRPSQAPAAASTAN